MSKSASYNGRRYGSIFSCNVPGRKPGRSPSLNRRPRQDDAVDLLVQQRRNRHSHGEVGLAGAGGANAKYHVMLLDGLEVAALIGAFRLDGAASKRTLASGFGQSTERYVRIANHHAQHAAQVAVDELVAGFPQMFIVGE